MSRPTVKSIPFYATYLIMVTCRPTHQTTHGAGSRTLLGRCFCCLHKQLLSVTAKHPLPGIVKFSTSAVSTFALLLLSQQVPRTHTPEFIAQQRGLYSNSGTDSEKNNKKSTDMAKPVISEELKKAKAEALWGMFVADSLAMPVHWYYNPSDIVRDHKKWLTGYVAPKGKHPSSILRLSAGDGSGRGSTTKKSVIGNVILHDKLKYWTGESSNNHYHQGMSAGDNTLNCVMALHEVQTLSRVDPNIDLAERDVQAAVLEDYVRFMTTPGSHSDTYAESFHRSLFKDWVAGGEPRTAEELIDFMEKRSESTLNNGRPDSQLVAIGCLVPAIPWILHHAHKSEAECARATVDFIKLTHPVQPLIAFVDIYARLLHAVLNGKDLKAEALRVFSNSSLGGPAKRDSVLAVLDKATSIPKGSEERLELYQALTAQLGMACYMDGALSSMLLLALEFHDDFEGGVLTNANCGGENCHRGAALGALLGAAAAHRGSGVPQHFKDGLGSLREGAKAAITDMSKL